MAIIIKKLPNFPFQNTDYQFSLCCCKLKYELIFAVQFPEVAVAGIGYCVSVAGGFQPPFKCWVQLPGANEVWNLEIAEITQALRIQTADLHEGHKPCQEDFGWKVTLAKGWGQSREDYIAKSQCERCFEGIFPWNTSALPSWWGKYLYFSTGSIVLVIIQQTWTASSCPSVIRGYPSCSIAGACFLPMTASCLWEHLRCWSLPDKICILTVVPLKRPGEKTACYCPLYQLISCKS